MAPLLLTDVALHLLFAMTLLGAWRASKKDHLHRAWGKVFNNSVGVVSLTVLLCFLIVGLLDSIRVEQVKESQNVDSIETTKVVSVLDVILTPLRTNVEKTYSEPFAHIAYAKEMSASVTGETGWAYPRLVHAGSHLSDPSVEKANDIFQKSIYGVGLGGLIWIVLCAIVMLLNKSRSFFKLSTGVRTCLYTLLVVMVLSGILTTLSPYYHILGTDKVGEDVLYQAIKSIRTGLVIGSVTTIIMLPIAISLGLAAGFFRGWADDIIQYVYTTLSSIPGVLLIAAAILMAQVYMANNPELFTTVQDRADMRLLLLCMILGITSWTGLCRLLRAETLKIREMDYVVAARALGVSKIKLLKRHVLPNVMHLVMITIVLDFSGLVLAEAVLSYINIGVDPSTYSWGNMINTSRLEMAREPVVWWSLTAAFIFMFGLVLAANLFADVVRDAFDPRSNN